MANDATTRTEPWTTAIKRIAALMALSSLGATLSIAQTTTCWTWGYNLYGQLGDGTDQSRNLPNQILAGQPVVQVSAGVGHSIVMLSNGRVMAFGDNTYGQLGDGTNTESWVPVLVSSLSDAVQISAGGSHNVAARADWRASAWGVNDGRLGNGNTNHSNIPVQVLNLFGVRSISGSETHSLALLSDGTVWAWGLNGFGQLGNGTPSFLETSPVQVTGLTGITRVAAGSGFSVALRSDRTVWTWGQNHFGQLGDGTNTSRSIAAPIGLNGVVAIACGQHFALAVLSPALNGQVWAWGTNENGELGNGSDVASNVPVQAVGLTNVVAVDAGHNHALALDGNGKVWSWGRNFDGQLGLGTNNWKESQPQEIPTLSNVTAISAGGMHSMALQAATRPVWGTITFGHFTGNPATIPIAFELIDPASSTVVYAGMVYTNEAAWYNWTTYVAPGTYHLRAKAPHWLRHLVSNVVFTVNGAANVNFTIVNGDVNGDNSVNVADFLALRQAFGTSSGGGGFNPNADLNGDGSVNVTDFLILRANFGQTGV